MSNEKALADWYKDDGDNTHFVSYPLTDTSVVFEVGGYKGDWASKVIEKYDCYVSIFEPIESFYTAIVDKFKSNKKVLAFNFGLADYSTIVDFGVKGDESCPWVTGDTNEIVSAVDVAEVLKLPVDLISINIEGGEYDLLLRMLETGIVKLCRNIQVQFHNNYPDCVELREDIRTRLSETHQETYCYPFVWESWRLKDGV